VGAPPCPAPGLKREPQPPSPLPCCIPTPIPHPIEHPKPHRRIAGASRPPPRRPAPPSHLRPV
jgi:hypothetical protein